MIILNTQLSIPPSEFELSYVRSSGPGGQNVNKVNSKAVLRWDLHSSNLPVETRSLLFRRLTNQLTIDGEIVITSDRFRDQTRNREDCFEKFKKLIISAMAVPKTRKKTKPSFSSQRKGKEAKNKHSLKKKLRGSSHAED
jgi:ribosome-associated protein